MKRSISIIGIVAGVVLLLGLGYYIRSRSLSGTNPDGSPISNLPVTNVDFTDRGSTSTPIGTGVGTFGRSVDAEVEAFYVMPSETVLYLERSGKVVKAAKNASLETLSSSPLTNIRSARFSFDGKRLLVGYGEGNIQWSVFDTEKKTWQPLAATILSATWAPSDNRIAYISARGIETIDMSAAKPQGQLIQKIAIADTDIFWPSPNKLVLADKPSAAIRNSILAFDMKTKEVNLLGEHLGYSGLWNFEGSRGVIFRGLARGKGGSFFEADMKGSNEKQFNFLTLPQKCAFSYQITPLAPSSSTPKTATSTRKEFLSCAIPRNQDRLFSEPLPDAYLKRALFTQDDLFDIDLASGQLIPLLAENSDVFDADMLQVQNGRVFFRNRIDHKIYSVKRN
jgi:hypothetical protein